MITDSIIPWRIIDQCSLLNVSGRFFCKVVISMAPKNNNNLLAPWAARESRARTGQYAPLPKRSFSNADGDGNGNENLKTQKG